MHYKICFKPFLILKKGLKFFYWLKRLSQNIDLKIKKMFEACSNIYKHEDIKRESKIIFFYHPQIFYFWILYSNLNKFYTSLNSYSLLLYKEFLERKIDKNYSFCLIKLNIQPEI